MPLCPMCLAGLPSSCLGESCEQTDITHESIQTLETLATESSFLGIPSLTPLANETTNDSDDGVSRRNSSSKRGRSARHASDSQSSGRKIAAKLYPLNGDAPCEWAGFANVGGGDHPILGCLEGKQQARHHGPEKNVQNNEHGNVHRICHYCHYRWHAANDPTYDWNAGVWPPHDPRPLTSEETKAQALDYMRYLTTGRRKKAKELD